jgi:hypothetical protein
MRPREGGNTNFGPRAAPLRGGRVRGRLRELNERQLSCAPILTAIVIGLVIGGIGPKYASCRRVIPAWRSILVAVAGAFGGTAIAHLTGLPTWALLFQIVMATLAVFVVTPAYRRRFARRWSRGPHFRIVEVRVASFRTRSAHTLAMPSWQRLGRIG